MRNLVFLGAFFWFQISVSALPICSNLFLSDFGVSQTEIRRIQRQFSEYVAPIRLILSEDQIRTIFDQQFKQVQRLKEIGIFKSDKEWSDDLLQRVQQVAKRVKSNFYEDMNRGMNRDLLDPKRNPDVDDRDVKEYFESAARRYYPRLRNLPLLDIHYVSLFKNLLNDHNLYKTRLHLVSPEIDLYDFVLIIAFASGNFTYESDPVKSALKFEYMGNHYTRLEDYPSKAKLIKDILRLDRR